MYELINYEAKRFFNLCGVRKLIKFVNSVPVQMPDGFAARSI